MVIRMTTLKLTISAPTLQRGFDRYFPVDGLIHSKPRSSRPIKPFRHVCLLALESDVSSVVQRRYVT